MPAELVAHPRDAAGGSMTATKPPPLKPRYRDPLTGLTRRETAFVAEYIKDRHAKNAAIRSGYSANRAHITGPELLRKPHIKIEVDTSLARIVAIAEEETGITLAKTVETIAKVAFHGIERLEEVTPAERKGYLDMLMKHLGGYAKDNAQTGEAAAGTLAALLQGIQRSAMPVAQTPSDEP
jgi:hypothetical protein